MKSIMLIKTLTLHSLTYIVSITSSIAMQQAIPTPGAPPGLQSAANTKPPIITYQVVVDRSVKSDRLSIKQVRPQADDRARVPGQIAPHPRVKVDCRPPIDVPGRCFADAGLNHKVA